jgi:hypothetical protein
MEISWSNHLQENLVPPFQRHIVLLNMLCKVTLIHCGLKSTHMESMSLQSVRDQSNQRYELVPLFDQCNAKKKKKKGSANSRTADGNRVGEDAVDDRSKMKTERCAYLSLVAVSNKLDEVWITQQPILLYLYLFQYFPTIAKWLGKRLGQSRIK